MVVSEHQCWTASATSYVRNLDKEDRRGEHIAVHYQKPPTHSEETGSTSIGLVFPTLIVSLYMSEPMKVAERVAAILNAHWDTFEMPDAGKATHG